MPELRTAPRVDLSCACTLHRRTGAPIEGRTLDVGVGGMRVSTTRPLAQDELLRFESLREPARARLAGVAT